MQRWVEGSCCGGHNTPLETAKCVLFFSCTRTAGQFVHTIKEVCCNRNESN